MDDLDQNPLDSKMNFVGNSYSNTQVQLAPNMTSGTTLPTAYFNQNGYGTPGYPQYGAGCSSPGSSSQANYAMPQWSHQVPTVMPWSNPSQPLTTCNIFQFTSSPNPVQYGTPQFTSPFSSSFHSSSSSITTATPSLIQTTSQLPNNLMPHNSLDMNVPFVNACIESCLALDTNENLNVNAKRNFTEFSEDAEYEFDFDRSRPIKKYICDDKVLEIFDRLHIREGEQYIVEDVIEESTNRPNHESKEGPLIEELDQSNDYCFEIELAPELRENLKKQCSITDKLIQAEKDKFSKALVVWQANPLHDLLTSGNSDEEENTFNRDTKTTSQVQIEEVISDDEEMMEDALEPIGVIIEPYQEEIVDQMME